MLGSVLCLEGDGLLAITCFEEIERVKTSLTVGHYPNMAAIAKTLASGNPSVAQQWMTIMTYGMNCVQPGIVYFHSKFGNDSSPPLNAFKAARPLKVNDLKPVAADIDSLKCIPSLTKLTIVKPSRTSKRNYLLTWQKPVESQLMLMC